jgi:hypothetical protein
MLRLIFWVVVLVLILSFFGISLRTLAASPATQENFAFVWQLVISGVHLILSYLENLVHLQTSPK